MRYLILAGLAPSIIACATVPREAPVPAPQSAVETPAPMPPAAPPADAEATACEAEVAELRSIDAQRDYIYQMNHAAIREGSTRATYEYIREEIIRQCMFGGCRFNMPEVSSVLRAVRAIENAQDEASLDALASDGKTP